MESFIQWKGTDICMDITCDCGHQSHIDGWFFYDFKCNGCNKVFKVGTSVQFTEIEDSGQECLSDVIEEN
jgi:hypothetical protein